MDDISAEPGRMVQENVLSLVCVDIRRTNRKDAATMGVLTVMDVWNMNSTEIAKFI